MAAYIIASGVKAAQTVANITNPNQAIQPIVQNAIANSHCFQVIVTSRSGACSAQVQFYGSNDGANWLPYGVPVTAVGNDITPGTASITGTTPFGYVGCVVTAITGTGASVTTNVSASVSQIIGSGGQSQTLLNPPAAFTSGSGWTPTFQVYRNANGTITTNLNPVTLQQPVTVTYCVNPLTGSDSNTGHTFNAGSSGPLLNWSTALAKADVDAIILEDFGVNNTIYRSTRSWNAVSPTRSIVITTRNGKNVYCVKASSVSVPTWTNFSGNCYSTSTAAGITNPVMIDLSILDAQGFGFILTGTTGSGAPGAAPSPGQFYLDTTNHVVYVTSSDSRNLVGDVNMIPPSTGNNGSINVSTDIAPTLWMSNISFVGGVPFNAQQLATLSNYPTLVFVSCTFQGGTGGANGTNTSGNFYEYHFGNGCSGNANDGFNIHGTDGSFGTQARRVLINCYTGKNGFIPGSASNNSVTQHEDCRTVGINNLWQNSQNRCFANIDTSVHWDLGSTIGPSLASGDTTAESVQAGAAAAQIYLDTCTLIPSAYATVESSLAACGVFLFNVTPPIGSFTTTGSGQIAAYAP